MMEKKKAKIKDALSFTKAGEAFKRLEAERDELISDMDMLAKQRDDSWRRLSIVEDQRDELLAALNNLVDIIDKAGLGNLSKGVQLGAMSWYVKASDAVEWAREAIAKCEVKS